MLQNESLKSIVLTTETILTASCAEPEEVVYSR